MTKDEIIKLANSASFDTMVPVTSVKTKEQVSDLAKQGYLIGYTEKELKKVFPGIPSEKLFYLNSLQSSIIYYDSEEAILFHVPPLMPGYEIMCKDPVEHINRGIELAKGMQDEGHIASLASLSDGLMRMQFTERHFKELSKKAADPYDEFFAIYRATDYGSEALSLDTLKYVTSLRTAQDIQDIEENLKDYPDPLPIYRGGADESRPYNEGWSWSLDKRVALFFSLRHGHEGNYLAQAHIWKKDIIAYLDSGESEIITTPDKLLDVSVLQMYGMDWLEGLGYKYLDIFQHLRDDILSEVSSKGCGAHDKAHSMRVMFLSLVLGTVEGLPEQDLVCLCMTAIFHDVGRKGNGVETGHGASSATAYKKYRAPIILLPDKKYGYRRLIIHDADPMVAFLIKYHDLSDEVAFSAISRMKAMKGQEKRAKQLYDIFKDADALDRVRLGLHDGIDPDMLRTDTAKRLPVIASIANEQLQL